MSIIKSFLAYSAGSLVVKTLLWIAVPIALYTVPPAVMGLWSLYNSFIALAAIVAALGLRQVFFIEYYHKNAQERRVMLNEIILLYCAYAVPLFSGLWYLRRMVNYYFFAGKASDILFFSCFFACFISFFTELLYQVLLYSRQTKLLIAVQIGGAALTAVSSIAVLWYSADTVVGLVISQIMGLLFVCACGAYLYYTKRVHYAAHALTRSKVYTYIINGLPFVPSVISFWCLSSVNRWLLASYATLADVGIYSCAEMVSMLFQMLILYPLSGAYLPLIMEQFAQHKNDHTRIDMQNKQYMLMGMSILLFVGTSLFFMGKPLLYMLIPATYSAVIPYLLLVGIGNIFLMGTYFVSCYIQYRKKSFFLAGSLIIAALINTALSSLLVPRYGVGGCIIASTIAYGAYFAITWWYNRVLHKAPYRTKMIIE